MVLQDEGLTELAQQFADLIANGQWGTGTASPTPTDGALGSAIVDTLIAPTGDSSGNTVQFTHSVPSTVGNPYDLTEHELQFTSGDSLNRTVGGAISKTTSFELITITTISFVRS